MSRPVYVNAVRESVGRYRIIDRHLDREAFVTSTSAASALRRYLGLCSIDHPFIDATIEAMGIDYAMTV